MNQSRESYRMRPRRFAARMLPLSMTRADNIPVDFVPAKQIAVTATLALVLMAAAAFLARGARPAAWLLVPAFWVFANFFEWTVHRFPMHRPLMPRIMYRNHAQIHHGAFADDSMAITDPRELSLIMMPWYTIVMLLCAASPVAIIAAVIGRPAVAGIFYLAALSYFVFYETVHALYHVPPETLARFGIRADGRGLFARMRAHHARHHAPRRMAHVNFNVTIPLADVVLGTRERRTPAQGRSAGGRPGARVRRSGRLFDAGRQFCGLGLGADLGRSVDADEVALARHPQTGRVDHHRGRLGRLGLFGQEDLADLLPLEEGIVGRRRDFLLRRGVDLDERLVRFFAFDLEHVLAGLFRARLAQERRVRFAARLEYRVLGQVRRHRRVTALARAEDLAVRRSRRRRQRPPRRRPPGLSASACRA